jgi:hypothetical protein
MRLYTNSARTINPRAVALAHCRDYQNEIYFNGLCVPKTLSGFIE